MDLSKSGERIKEMRKKAGLTQDQLASRLSGIETARGKSTISEYEHGKNLTLNNLQRMADELNCDVDYLLGCIEHPDITTSWIAEKVPLSRKAIESLEYLNKDTGHYYPIIAASILDSLIIGITDAVKESCESSESIQKGESVYFSETVISDAMNLEIAFEQIADYEATGSSFNDHPEITPREYSLSKIAAEGLSAKIGSQLSKLVVDTLKKSGAQRSNRSEV